MVWLRTGPPPPRYRVGRPGNGFLGLWAGTGEEGASRTGDAHTFIPTNAVCSATSRSTDRNDQQHERELTKHRGPD